MTPLGSTSNPLRVAIVGSGPSGFYAAEELLKSDLSVTVDMIDRLPTPFGLVRSGVAPDHPKLKMPAVVFDKVAHLPGFAFFGNIMVGRDISVEELQATHHAVIFACGAQSERSFGIPGESLPGSHTATEFVGWYNGHPDYRDRHFDLSQEIAVVVGQGNVAADVARILSKPVDELKTTDISTHAIDALAASKVREIHIIGRRGPAQAKFTNKELKELGELNGCVASVTADDLRLNPESQLEIADKNNYIAAKNIEILNAWAASPVQAGGKRIVFHFLESPVEIGGEGRVQRLMLERNRLEGSAFDQQAKGTGQLHELSCGLVFRSIGYRGIPIPGVPFDERKGIFPHEAGRIVGRQGLYVAGWIKRGPSGIIGTNRACSLETVATLRSDLASMDSGAKPGFSGLTQQLAAKSLNAVDYAGWQAIDALETQRGAALGKPREKMTRIEEMLAVACR